MSGLEKIIGQIGDEAGEKVGKLTADAEAKAAAILRDSESRTAQDVDRITKKAGQEAAGILERGKASAELREKQILLSGRQELINEALLRAKKTLSELPDAEYLGILGKLFEKYAPEKDAVLRFSAKDLQRVPAAMVEDFKKKALEKGAALTVSGEPAEIKDGFLLDYGGIEENCSFDALIDENMEKLQDEIKNRLFS